MAARMEKKGGLLGSRFLMIAKKISSSSLPGLSRIAGCRLGLAQAGGTSMVASPPSSRIMLGCAALPIHHAVGEVPVFLQRLALVREHGMPALAMAAAAWSCVEKMLHLTQRTSAPSAVSVSISTAVWMVMCSEPAMRAPLSGCVGVFLADGHQAGHLDLGDVDFLAAEVGERNVLDDVVLVMRIPFCELFRRLSPLRQGRRGTSTDQSSASAPEPTVDDLPITAVRGNRRSSGASPHVPTKT